MSNPVIQVADLKFGYSPQNLVLDIPEMRIETGETLFLHGPSGSGKTTFLGLVAGVLAANSGKIEVLGRNLVGLSAGQRDQIRGSHLGYIFQQFNLIPYLSVVENISLPCWFNKERRNRVSGNLESKAIELCEHLGIGRYIRSPVGQLSVGQQQRVAAARALIGGPELIIADEPTSALDADHRKIFIELLFAEAKTSGSTVLFVSHDHSLRPLFNRSLSLVELNKFRQQP